MTAATAASTDSSRAETRTVLLSELALVDEMLDVAEASRYDADPRVRKIIDWIEADMCRGLSGPGATPPQWNDCRLLIFTEYEDTRRWLQRCLSEAIAHSDRASERIATFTGMTSRHRREDIKHAFNTEPGDHPLRILIATDAAREGLNLQRHCHDLFHFDLPWNPSRLDQRNGRIDRKLQPADEVFCRYFVYSQRPEDRILQVLVNKVERIRQELGSVAKVLEGRIARTIGAQGMRRDGLDKLAAFIEDLSPGEQQRAVDDELEDARLRQDRLREEVDGLRTRLERSRTHIGLTAPQFRQNPVNELEARLRSGNRGGGSRRGARTQHPAPLRLSSRRPCARERLRLDCGARCVACAQAERRELRRVATPGRDPASHFRGHRPARRERRATAP